MEEDLRFPWRGPRGFKSHPPHQNSGSVSQVLIYLKGTEPTNKSETHVTKQDKVFEQALRRLKSASDILDEEKASILGLVQHLLAKGVGKLRVVKYINHRLIVSRMALEIACKPLISTRSGGNRQQNQHGKLHRPHQARLSHYYQVLPVDIVVRRGHA